MALNAETAYLFRHAILREAAYQLHLPADRSSLHALALDVIEAVVDADALPPLAAELVQHARGAMANAADPAPLRRKEARYLEMQLTHTREGYDHAGSLDALQRLRLHPDVNPADRLRFQREYGLLLHSLGRNTEADQALQAVIRDAGLIGNTRERVLAQQVLTQLYRVIQRVPDAETLSRQAMEGARAMGDSQLEATVKRTLAMLLLRTGRSAEAEEALKQAAQTHSTGEVKELAADLANLGLLQHQNGRLPEAEANLREALAMIEPGNDERSKARILANLSNILADRADVQGARILLERAGESFRRCGDLSALALLQCNLGALLREDGGLAQAEATYRRAAELCRDLGETRHQAYSEAGLAAILVQRERFADAAQLLVASIETMRRFGDLHNVCSLQCELAIVRLRQGDDSLAETLLWEALALARDTSYARMEASALAELGAMYFARGRLAAGMALTNEAVRISEPAALAVNTAMWRTRRASCRLLLGDIEAAHDDERLARETLGSGLEFYRLFHWFPLALRLACWGAELEVPHTQLHRVRELAKAETARLERLRGQEDRDSLRQTALAERLLGALDRAAAANRPAMLFCGYEPESLPAAQRSALLARMAAVMPEHLTKLKRGNPELVEALRQGVVASATPRWDDPDLPQFTPRAAT